MIDIDDIYEAKRKEAEAKYKESEDMIRYIFSKTEQGIYLLNVWKRSLMMTPDVEPGMDLLSIGIAAGKKEFIRKIILITERDE